MGGWAGQCIDKGEAQIAEETSAGGASARLLAKRESETSVHSVGSVSSCGSSSQVEITSCSTIPRAQQREAILGLYSAGNCSSSGSPAASSSALDAAIRLQPSLMFTAAKDAAISAKETSADASLSSPSKAGGKYVQYLNTESRTMVRIYPDQTEVHGKMEVGPTGFAIAVFNEGAERVPTEMPNCLLHDVPTTLPIRLRKRPASHCLSRKPAGSAGTMADAPSLGTEVIEDAGAEDAPAGSEDAPSEPHQACITQALRRPPVLWAASQQNYSCRGEGEKQKESIGRPPVSGRPPF